MSGTFEDLHAWRLSMDLVVAVYQQTLTWPNDERLGLTGQNQKSGDLDSKQHCRGKRKGIRPRAHQVSQLRPRVSLRSSNPNQGSSSTRLPDRDGSASTLHASCRSWKGAERSNSRSCPNPAITTGIL